MKPSRHQAREVALQILYRYDIGLQAAANTQAPGDIAPEIVAKLASELIGELNRHFDHFNVPLELRRSRPSWLPAPCARCPADGLLEKHAANWKIGRMGFVDRNLLRMSIYELSHFPDTPASVVIDEAIELAKQFGTAESPAFVNGVLDAVKDTDQRHRPNRAKFAQ